MAVNLRWVPDGIPKPVILYVHGFNGFKDWGGFSLIADAFASAGFVCCTFNLSHNGTTPEHPQDFADPEAYGRATYSMDLADIRTMRRWLADPAQPLAQEMEPNRLILLGHSRGGGLALLSAAEDAPAAVITWASVAECKTPWGNWPEERIKAWARSGTEYYVNQRTGQSLPIYYTLYQDYLAHREQLDIQQALSRLHMPVQICHGRSDAAVPVQKAELLKSWYPAAELRLCDSDHVFGRSHPWTRPELPTATLELIAANLDFLRRHGF